MTDRRTEITCIRILCSSFLAVANALVASLINNHSLVWSMLDYYRSRGASRLEHIFYVAYLRLIIVPFLDQHHVSIWGFSRVQIRLYISYCTSEIDLHFLSRTHSYGYNCLEIARSPLVAYLKFVLHFLFGHRCFPR